MTSIHVRSPRSQPLRVQGFSTKGPYLRRQNALIFPQTITLLPWESRTSL